MTSLSKPVPHTVILPRLLTASASCCATFEVNLLFRKWNFLNLLIASFSLSGLMASIKA